MYLFWAPNKLAGPVPVASEFLKRPHFVRVSIKLLLLFSVSELKMGPNGFFFSFVWFDIRLYSNLNPLNPGYHKLLFLLLVTCHINFLFMEGAPSKNPLFIIFLLN